MRLHESLSARVFRVMQPFNEPDPKNPPTSWSNLVRTRLMPEIHTEIALFYGDDESLEAQHAGLDYAYEPHRRRLGRFPYHNRLFRALDWLNLTHHEIKELCTWEGTLFAKEKYERDHCIRIRDTTADSIPMAAGVTHYDPPHPYVVGSAQQAGYWEMDDESEEDENAELADDYDYGDEHELAAEAYEDDVDMDAAEERRAHVAEENQGELLSIGTALNNRLLDVSLTQGLDPLSFDFNVEWEAWLKEAQDSGRWGDLSSRLPSQL